MCVCPWRRRHRRPTPAGVFRNRLLIAARPPPPPPPPMTKAGEGKSSHPPSRTSHGCVCARARTGRLCLCSGHVPFCPGGGEMRRGAFSRLKRTAAVRFPRICCIHDAAAPVTTHRRRRRRRSRRRRDLDCRFALCPAAVSSALLRSPTAPAWPNDDALATCLISLSDG